MTNMYAEALKWLLWCLTLSILFWYVINDCRLIHYNAKTKENTVLIDGINFANGVALSEDEEFVIVAETAGSRILRYYLKGPKKG